MTASDVLFEKRERNSFHLSLRAGVHGKEHYDLNVFSLLTIHSLVVHTLIEQRPQSSSTISLITHTQSRLTLLCQLFPERWERIAHQAACSPRRVFPEEEEKKHCCRLNRGIEFLGFTSDCITILFALSSTCLKCEPSKQSSLVTRKSAKSDPRFFSRSFTIVL